MCATPLLSSAIEEERPIFVRPHERQGFLLRREFLGEIESLRIEGNPLPCSEWRKLNRVLGTDVIENSCGKEQESAEAGQ